VARDRNGSGVCVTACPIKALWLKVRSPEKMEKYYESIKEYFAELPPSDQVDGDVERAEYIH
jgi:ferredoxin